MKSLQRFTNLAIFLLVLAQMLSPGLAYAGFATQGQTPEARAEQLLEGMTPEERVGQLFLVTFQGSNVEPDSTINNLISNHHIGGVILKKNNDNFTGPDDTLTTAWQLNQSLQQAEWDASQGEMMDPLSNEPFTPIYIPLFIGISQNGDNAPSDQILSGVTPLPSLMAIGATWDTKLSYSAGEVLGRELSSLGFNLLLGPSLVVLEDPQAESAGDLGVRTFGGNPYWVASMGRAYISGLHDGSNDQIIVAGKHFPGVSSADRPLEEEIPTVRKSLEQLMQTELVPYFAVTGDAPDAASTVDALVLANAKYEGFQGNISPATRPISFDPQAFQELMSITEFSTWRSQGGLIISEELGTRAIRRFEDPSENTFNARLVALNAFLAGNDLLNLGNFVSTEDPDGFTTILRTLDFFSLKYREDAAFSQRVDDAVLRILTAKFHLYEQFDLDHVLIPQTQVNEIKPDTQVSFDIARQAVTLLSPAASSLENVLPAAPAISEQIVIITDTYTASQCSTCQEQYVLSPNALKQAILRLYGPVSGGRVLAQNIITYSFADLEANLKGLSEGNQLFTDIQKAKWVVFLILDASSNRPASMALGDFLSQRPDLIQNKKSVVFALNAPYYLDATDISNISAYYGLYSKQPQFIEVAARVLFKEINAPGASPVSVKGVAYDLTQMTLPDPDQVFTLQVNPVTDEDEEVTPTPPIAAGEDYFLGDPVTVQTGTILDYNRKPVPDNTAVRLLLTAVTTDGNTIQREHNAVTLDGIARFSLVLEVPGTMEIQAFSGQPQAASEIIQIEIADPFGQGPLIQPTSSQFADQTPAQPEVTPQSNGLSSSLLEGHMNAWHWVLLILVSVFVSLFAYQIGATTGKVRWGIRWALSAFICGMLSVTYFSFGLVGSSKFMTEYHIWGIVIATAISALAGWGIGWIWFRTE
jgi:beta-N-acetylhexosaminidase